MTDRYPFLSSTAPSAPKRLLDQARSLPTPRVALVNAGAINPLNGIKEAAQEGFAEPILIGDRTKIEAAADEVGYDIGGLRVEH
ncbi:MAG: phosphate acetyltransferase, partial [Pseudomonadota bacterium]